MVEKLPPPEIIIFLFFSPLPALPLVPVPKAAPTPGPRPPPRRIFPCGPQMLFRSRTAARPLLLSYSPHTEA